MSAAAVVVRTALPRQWFLYLIECANGALYAGITTDVAARYTAHACGKGAKFTRANPPRQLIGVRPFADRAAAARAEYAIKRLPRASKVAFLQMPDVVADGLAYRDASVAPSPSLPP